MPNCCRFDSRGHDFNIPFPAPAAMAMGSSPHDLFLLWLARTENHFLIYPLVMSKYLWKITRFNGEKHYKWPFSMVMLNYQRVQQSLICLQLLCQAFAVPVIPEKNGNQISFVGHTDSQ